MGDPPSGGGFAGIDPSRWAAAGGTHFLPFSSTNTWGSSVAAESACGFCLDMGETDGTIEAVLNNLLAVQIYMNDDFDFSDNNTCNKISFGGTTFVVAVSAGGVTCDDLRAGVPVTNAGLYPGSYTPTTGTVWGS